MREWIAEFGGKKTNGFFHRNIYVKLGDNFEAVKNKFINSYNNTDIYQCAYVYENDEYNTCNIIGDPYLDFDVDDIESNYSKLVKEVKYVINYLETSLGLPPDELNIFFSGHKGFHVIIPGEAIGLIPSTTINQDFKYFALGMAYVRSGKILNSVRQDLLDLKIYDRKRLFRLPNSINSKSGLYKVPVTIEQLYDFSYEDIKEWASSPREIKTSPAHFRAVARDGYLHIIELGKDYEALKDGKKRSKRPPRKQLANGERLDLLPCAMYLLEHGTNKGTRNHSCFALASSLFQAGYNIDEVFEGIDEWNQKNEELLAPNEIATTITSAFNSYNNGMVVGCGKYKDLDLCQDNCNLMTDWLY